MPPSAKPSGCWRESWNTALATVQALAVHTLRGSPSPEAFIKTFSGRLAALDHAHSLLMQHYYNSVPLHDLLAQQLDPYRSTERTEWR